MSDYPPCYRENQAVKLYVESKGNGPEVVLLHGWGMHSGVWEDVVAALVEDFRVTVIDLPGHGFSRGFAAGNRLRDLSAAVASVAPPRAHWVGWSLGGMVTQRLASDATERVAKLVLISSSPCFVQRPDWPHAMRFGVLHLFAETLGQNYQATLKRFLALEVHGSDHAGEQLRRLRNLVFQHGEPDAAALRDGLSILENEDLRAELSRIHCPTLLMMGRRDSLVPVSAGTAIQALLPNAHLQVFPQAGHAPFLSHRREFIRHLKAFLDD
jgi:pimeloyl-[acyl-carrier protein] methyl ester esterase